MPIGAAFLLFIGRDTAPVVMGIGPFIMGFGMGLLNITSMVMVQGSVEWSKRGSATASLIFSRTLGNTFGVTVLGAILNFGVISYASSQGKLLNAEQIRVLLGSIGNVLGGAADPALRDALDGALGATFAGMLIFAVLAAALAALVPVRELETLSGETRRAPASPVALREQENIGA